MASKQAKKIAEKAKKWVGTAEGHKSIETALESATKASEQLEKARRVDPSTLEKPFTV